MTKQGTALITGANRGIGLGLTRHLLFHGWRVIAACRRPDSAPDLHAAERAYPNRCDLMALDVQDPASVEVMAKAFLCGSQTIDVLVNNAGINPEPDQSIDVVSVDVVADTLETNLLGALRVLQATLPALRRSSSPRIVNVSSGAGSLAHNSSKRPQPGYCISKAALNMLTICAARDLPDITVVSISPGWIRTDMGGPGGDLDRDEATATLASTIESLQLRQSGHWLDRFGETSAYAW